MRPIVLYVFIVVCLFNSITCELKNIRTVSAPETKDIAKRAATAESDESNSTGFYPDWVPFHKNIEELGEFVRSKPKPKKRLALPVNYVLRVDGNSESDDYSEKLSDDNDNDDNFEKKEWSDLNRAANDYKLAPNISVSASADIIDYQDAHNNKQTKPIKVILKDASIPITDEKIKSNNEDAQSDKEEKEPEKKTTIQQRQKSSKVSPKINNYDDYDDKPVTHKHNKDLNEETTTESILKVVDALKEEHQTEQKRISEQSKQEELDSEEQKRDSLLFKDLYKRYYQGRKPIAMHEYEDYSEIKDDTNKRKYSQKRKTNRKPKSTTTPKSATAQRKRYRESTRSYEQKSSPSFRTTTQDLPQKTYLDSQFTDATNTNSIFERTTKKSLPTTSEPTTDSVKVSTMISLRTTDRDVKETKPVHFGRKRKPKRKRKQKSTTSAPDSSVAESVEDQASAKTSTATVATTAIKNLTTPTDTVYTNSDSISDAVPASTEHKKEGGGDTQYKRAGGKEHHSSESSEHAEHGKKAYEGHHEEHKTKKGHHDKEQHDGHYDDKGGHDKHHHDESEHYGGHHHEEHGKKHAKYEESGKHSKGHNTKGSHDVHKKEEYEKKVEFFEEDGDSGEEEKHGGYTHEKEHSSGGHFKHGKLQADHSGGEKGHSGHHVGGGHGQKFKEHSVSGGHDSHGKHGQESHHKQGLSSGKKWIYHHGHPAKTANLVAIDRRGDRYYQGPRYFG